ncbi:hypothetical protein GRX03_01505 [Halovenus sp. WSH3]|uniref:Uncharacterized protein n=1 Tax=Halovenus carboxidivorans TaxID=2692199 RepID=A0A6B0T224_9EURY|nr:hypothetical protein [Halovenus carboxidivorans]MXR50286.1 hypothetical protein [Halovenus carboxidivorans]
MRRLLSASQTFDLTIITGAFVALYWILYVDPLTGEIVGLALGTIPVLAGVVRYVEPEQYVSQTLTGAAAVALGGGAPATILYGTPAGTWLVGSRPLPLALGTMLAVVGVALVARRSLGAALREEGVPTA